MRSFIYMEALIAAAAGACAPGCAGLVAAAGLPVFSLVGIASAVGLAILRSRAEPIDDDEKLPEQTAREPTSTTDFL